MPISVSSHFTVDCQVCSLNLDFWPCTEDLSQVELQVLWQCNKLSKLPLKEMGGALISKV